MTWQPIETAPKDGTRVLLWLREPWSRVEIASFFPEWGTWIDIFPSADDETYGIGSNVPTHWMPLPDAPERGE